MAAAAMVACANGTVTFAKRNLLDQIIDSVEALQNQDVHVTIELFNSFADEIRFQPEQGQRRALASVAAVAAEKYHAELVLKVALAVGRADGLPTPAEQHRIDEIKSALRLPPNLPEEGRTDPLLKSKGPDAKAGVRKRSTGSDDAAGSAAERGAPQTQSLASASGNSQGPTIIAIGNEKGGTGKSTAAIHLSIALLRSGYKVGTLDLDGRQATFTHYLTNRKALSEKQPGQIVIPRHHRIHRSNSPERVECERQERSKIRYSP